MKRLAVLPLVLAACASGADVASTPTPPDFSVVEASRDAVTIRSDADPTDPAIVAEAQRVCGAYGESATYISSHDSDEVNEAASALTGLYGYRHAIYVTDHLFACAKA